MSIDILSELEQRIDALERQLGDQLPPDNLQPNVLVVNPDGTIGAQFSGGVQMKEQPSNAFNPSSGLGWLDSAGGGQIREYILGSFTGGQHTLWLASNPGAIDQAALELNAVAGGSAGSANVSVTVQDNAHANASATLLDSRARSTFAQLGLGASLLSAANTGTLSWNVATPISNTLSLTLPGASVAVRGIVSCDFIRNPGVFDWAVPAVVSTPTGIQIQARSLSNANPGAAATCNVSALLWGT